MSVATRQERVSNARLRTEFLARQDRGWLTAEQVAVRMDWFRPHSAKEPRSVADVSRVLRKLGIKSGSPHNGARYIQRTVDRETAARLARAMNCDPHEVGL